MLDLRRVSGRGTLTTTRVGREVDRAFAALRGAFRTHAAGEAPRAPRPPNATGPGVPDRLRSAAARPLPTEVGHAGRGRPAARVGVVGHSGYAGLP